MRRLGVFYMWSLRKISCYCYSNCVLKTYPTLTCALLCLLFFSVVLALIQNTLPLFVEMASPCQVHNVRFYDLPPRSAHCLAYSRSRNLLALSRADNSIEVWHLGYGNDKQRNNKISVAPVMQRIIPANETQGSVEALVWAGGGNKTNNCIDDQINTDKDGEVGSVFSFYC